MSGVRFITDDPVGVGYDREWDRLERRRIRDQQIATDAAMRGGIQDMLSTEQAAGLTNAGGYLPPTTAGAMPAAAPSSDQRDMAIRTIAAEAGNEPDEGVAAVAHVIGNRVRSGKWGGDAGSVVTAPQQFSPWNPGSGNDPRRFTPDNPVYQRVAAIYDRVMRGEIPDPTGGALHFANPAASTAGWVRDAEARGGGLRIGNHVFYQGVDAGMPGTTIAAPQPGQQATATPGQRRTFDYQPILSRLAQTPGGGRTAMTMLGQANRTNMALDRRQEQYERMVGTALSQGNVAGAQYYAGLAGVTLPDAILRDAGQAKRAGAAIRLSQQFYRNDPEAGQRFAAAYVRSGSVDQAFAEAGPPRDNPSLQVVKVREGEQDVLYGVNRRTGTAAPISTGAPGVEPVNDGTWSEYAPPTQAEPRPLTSDRPPAGGTRPGGAGRPTATEINIEAMKRGGMTDEQIAGRIAKQDAERARIANLYARFATAASSNFDLGRTPEEKRAWVEQQMDAAMPGWRNMQGRSAPAATDYVPPTAGPSAYGYGAGPSAAPPAAAAQPVPSVATQSPNRGAGTAPQRPQNVPQGSMWSPSRQMWRDQQGNLYDAQGSPVQARRQ